MYVKATEGLVQQHLQEIGGSVVADSFVLRNRQLLVAAKRYGQVKQT